jgi:hypothetical protein
VLPWFGKYRHEQRKEWLDNGTPVTTFDKVKLSGLEVVYQVHTFVRVTDINL